MANGSGNIIQIVPVAGDKTVQTDNLLPQLQQSLQKV